MSHLRMNTADVVARSTWKAKFLKPGGYLFTQSLWHCQKYVGDDRLILETGFRDPNEIFPVRVMMNIEYGIKFGLLAHVVEYVVTDEPTVPIGAILTMYIEDWVAPSGEKIAGRHVGHYGVRYNNMNA